MRRSCGRTAANRRGSEQPVEQERDPRQHEDDDPDQAADTAEDERRRFVALAARSFARLAFERRVVVSPRFRHASMVAARDAP